ncbi:MULTISPECIES: VanZ family protein [Pseudonocardia]|uniref:VanZ like family protein n=2 Tax=Pseudonocardia TaxID=1847 RepID=A0A1Y2N6N8_PSEAH|nr:MULTISPECIES: VanZ family protein [Pseudonocardia]OSY43134.1 VanZ like family protein [Pseudonocardia autotrophica]TDN71622.1 glycopeptide antibiotics resistance protein [Pseudonocardia autotrophica]BBG02309.1 hypothetical protein Pdca_35180 [Pseudonocardia autotrophica]GEC23355.1 hypothetical protein PSA01_03840 [Pseudonocardia saturnea]
MNDRTFPAIVAVLLGTVIVLAVLVPVVAASYRRRGRFGLRELAVAVAVPVYGLAVMTYTLLPLPEVDAAFCAARSSADGLQLRPFQFVADIARIAGRQEATGVRAWLANSAVQQIVLNVVLFVPLGWLLRGPGRRSTGTAVLAGFGLSLLVETTQYTGNWFLFPCSYRVADVDDLIANTAGALLGALLVALLRPRSDEVIDPGRPAPVTAGRRLLGALCDVLAVAVGGTVLGALVGGLSLAAGMRSPFPGWYAPISELASFWLPLLVFLLVPLFGAGGTIGQRTVRLRPASPDGGVPACGVRLLRVLLGTGGVILLTGPSGSLGVLGFLWSVASLVGLFRTAGHTGLAGRITGLVMIDSRVADRPAAAARPVPNPENRRT